jgi:hypothetical protein
MKRSLFGLALLFCCCAAQAQDHQWGWELKTFAYRNLDDSTAVDNALAGAVGWGSCTTCAGGQNEDTAVINTAPFQNPPSIDGASRIFTISGLQYANGAWWYKVGPNDKVNKFKFDFWLQVDEGTLGAQALEFDAFQYIIRQGRTKYFWGTQCNYFTGFWDLWNEGGQAWEETQIPCQKFTPGVWYHVTLRFRREHCNPPLDKYETLDIVQYDSKNKIACKKKYVLNAEYPAGTLPTDYTENMGVQFQMDLGASGGTMSEWVDKVNLFARKEDNDREDEDQR